MATRKIIMLRVEALHKAALVLLGLAAMGHSLADDVDGAAAHDSGCLSTLSLSGVAAPPRIGSIAVVVEDVFDASDPRENGVAYRLTNALHYTTRQETIRRQLIFKEGDVFDPRVLEETGRLLRNRRYLYDARVRPAACHADRNTVDVLVRVRDVWSLSPGVSFGRKGGANSSRIEFEDRNLLGRGKHLSLTRAQNVDRATVEFVYEDPNVLGSRWQSRAGYADNSDGHLQALLIERPFYSLDTHWSVGFDGKNLQQQTSRYASGERVDAFDERTERLSVFGGWSRGKVNGWTRRWLAGVRVDRSRFAATPDIALAAALPADRNWVYPWMGMELIEDDFDTTHNRDQIQRTEDVYFGRQLRAELGLASGAALFDLRAGSGYRLNGESDSLFLFATGSGRFQQSSLRDGLLSAEARYYHRQSAQRLFFASLELSRAFSPDLDHQLMLGGDNGLRGYPLRYQGGDTRLLATVEQRFFSEWYPLRLVHVGAAVFADAGRTWGSDVFGNSPAGWLSDVGCGLRLGNARSSLGNVLHLDVAFPLGGTGAIGAHGGVQFLIQTKKSF